MNQKILSLAEMKSWIDEETDAFIRSLRASGVIVEDEEIKFIKQKISSAFGVLFSLAIKIRPTEKL